MVALIECKWAHTIVKNGHSGFGKNMEPKAQIKYMNQTHGEATLTSLLFNEDRLHPYIGKDSTELVTCKPKTTRLLTKN
jgi:hypothetical protein